MMYAIGDNIVCGLGFNTDEVYSSVRRDISGVKRCEGTFGVHEPFMASLVDESMVDDVFDSLHNSRSKSLCRDYTKFEKMMIISAQNAIEKAGVDASGRDFRFILSTTKGNVDLLGRQNTDSDRVYLWRSAELLSEWFGNTNIPIVVSNSCVSGACAQIAASREINSGTCRYVAVVGAEVLSKFIVSGFQSFKALSSEECRPFDKSRTGLNLGEAAATIVYSSDNEENKGNFAFCSGAIRNDANHISGPSRTAEGLFNVLDTLTENISSEQVAFINAHGTATLYNDEMESIAISRSGLNEIPVNSLKPYFGHTMGAAGVLETIISSRAANDGIVLGSRGFAQSGVSCSINISNMTKNIPERGQAPYFIKMLSGFGGSNAAILLKRVL